MKKSFAIISLIHMALCISGQSLTKNSLEAETFISKELCKSLFTKLNPKFVQKGYVKSFSVKFELNENAVPKNVQLSVNMTDTLVINMVISILAQSQKIWDIEQCKKYNPTLKFILPIHMETYSRIDVNSNVLTDKSNERLDFKSLIKFPFSEQHIGNSPISSREKFVGMVLSPILIDNTKPFE